MGRALASLTAVLLAAATPGEPVITLDCPERVTIGDSCRLIVEIAAAPGDRVEIPEKASDPPHSKAKVIWLAGTEMRSIRLAAWIISLR